MSGMKKVALYAVAIAGLLAALAFAYLFTAYPAVDPPPMLSVEKTPERLARGAYLVNHVSACIDCHSTRNWAYFAGPVTPGTEGKGGDPFGENVGVPGTLYAKNITPAALGAWTDGEIFRALSSGVDRHGKALFPLMPYPSFNEMTDEDLFSIIAYIRTLTPIENTIPERTLNFPLNFIVRTIPARHRSQPLPDTSNAVTYGKYLVNAAGCTHCHTQQDHGDPIEGMDFAGGSTFETPAGTIRSANITPDEETGIGTWPREVFVARFKDYARPEMAHIDTATMGRLTIMPWMVYAGMTERDLEAVYAYLRTVHPVKNRVDTFTR